MPCYQSVLSQASTFKLKQRALHVWSEADRVTQFTLACEDADAASEESRSDATRRLGELMLTSHHSCQQLYECSCPELDELVECAMNAGAFGARLTGAGWGGCVVALIAKAEVQQFTEHLQRDFYGKSTQLCCENAIFESTPSSGTDVYSVVIE